jgi:hypothetical protein
VLSVAGLAGPDEELACVELQGGWAGWSVCCYTHLFLFSLLPSPLPAKLYSVLLGAAFLCCPSSLALSK